MTHENLFTNNLSESLLNPYFKNKEKTIKKIKSIKKRDTKKLRKIN